MEFNFELKKTAIYQAVKQARNPIFYFADFLKKTSLIFSIACQVIFIYGFILLNPENIGIKQAIPLSAKLPLRNDFSYEFLLKILGGAVIFLSLFVLFWLLDAFLNYKLKKPKLKIGLEEALKNPENYNLAEFLSFETARAVIRAKNNTTHLFYELISLEPKLNFIFSRALLSVKEVKKILRQYLSSLRKTPLAKEVLLEFQTTLFGALKIAKEKGHKRVEVGDMLSSLAKHDLIFKKILIDTGLKAEDIENLAIWLEELEQRIEKRKKFWEWENLIRFGSIGKDWAAGYTPLLDKFSVDMSEIVKRANFPRIIGHQKEILQMERILSRREINNALIIGEPGCGRKSLVEALALNSALGKSLPEVNYKRVVKFDLLSLLAQTGGVEECEAVLDNVFKEVISAGNIILVIDEFHNFIGGEARPGAIDISGVIMPYLPLPEFQIVAITTYEGLHRNIELNTSLLNLFEKVEVSGVSERETLFILEEIVPLLEFKYKKFISYPALKSIVNYCSKYQPSLAFPEKAVNLSDEAIIHLAQTEQKVLLPRDVAKVLSEKIQIPVGELETKEKEVLLNLEKLIHLRIVNQEEAVKEVSTALRRARAEISARSRPMGSFLFLGPTGVGKTETSKALAEFYFGSEKRMIRLDMSEFQQIKDIPRLIGSFGEEGLLTTQVRENPFAAILLDEIEKAHPNILNLFLQILDEGFVTDGLGRKVIFRETIIIATSNAGYQIILNAIEEKVPWSGVKQKLLSFLFEKGAFRPEFINRFDAVVIFKPLDKNNLFEIAELLLQKIKKGLKEKEIEFVITDPLKEKIVELSYDPKFGAREMRRVIQDKVENVLARALLLGEIKRGETIKINSANFQIVKSR